MQLVVVNDVRRPEHMHLIEDMWRLRARVFAGRLNWQVEIKDGLERDQFDEQGPTYILGVENDLQVVGCVRLLPPLRSSMLQEVFPELLDREGLVMHERMIESSRFCIDRSGRAGGTRATIVQRRTRILLAAIVEWSLAHGYHELVTATDLKFERLLSMVGWPLRRLGDPKLINETQSVAGSLPISHEVLMRLTPPGYIPLDDQFKRAG